MPAYTWLFDGAADRPRQEARDLVAYLDSLGRARALAGPEGNQRAREACQCPDDEMAQMAFEGPLDAHPARTRRSREAPAMPASGDIARGEQLYAGHCASCHGTKGDGTGPGASMLSPRPGNLAEHEYSEARLAAILWNGVYGSAMPAWRDRPLDELAALIAVVRRLGSSEPERQVPESLVELGARVYAANCSQCHGEKGEGNGSAVPQLTMDPTDFHQQRPSLAESLRVLRGGIAGTPMVPWTTRLSDAELVAVANFVRGFYEGERPR
jgi:mono/diheme cytochrome c family protein